MKYPLFNLVIMALLGSTFSLFEAEAAKKSYKGKKGKKNTVKTKTIKTTTVEDMKDRAQQRLDIGFNVAAYLRSGDLRMGDADLRRVKQHGGVDLLFRANGDIHTR